MANLGGRGWRDRAWSPRSARKIGRRQTICVRAGNGIICWVVNSSGIIRQLFVSPGHNFFGRHGQPAGSHPTIELQRATCRAGRGIEGDRFFNYRAGYKGQVTFFAWETCEAIKAEFRLASLSAGAFRRNIVVQGLDLNALIDWRFALGGVEFEGVVEARPCYWMDAVVAPGAEKWLRGRGGLRARVLTDGEIAVGSAPFRLLEEVA
jgi:MOSC domain-containing protein YiiM